MNNIMISKFCKIAKEFIPAINEEGLKNSFINTKTDIDEEGPCCSDSKLMNLFRSNIKYTISDDKLYGLIYNICIKFVYA